MRKEIATQVQETQKVQNRIKPKAKHPKIHINEINKDQTQKANIKNSKGKATNNAQGDSHKLPKLYEEEIENLNRTITSTQIEIVIRNLPTNKALDQMASQLNYIKNLEKS